ncbi:glycosyltransferase family 2 protein [Nocardioidaceae bacterium]|nr:glycosyltransferase family 2 protein [Nocardioidaceae bacterium]
MSMTPIAVSGVVVTWLVLVTAAYGALRHLGLLALTGSAFAEARVYRRRRAFAAYDESFGDPLARGVSLVVAVRDRADDVVDLVRSMTSLRYPEFDLVVVDDGSEDGTATVLVEALGLREVPVTGSGALMVRAPVTACWHGRRGGVGVTLLRKEAAGLADAWNAGADVARHPLCVVVDAQVTLDPDALLHVARPFADDPQRMVATTGVVRVLNGCTVRGGRVTEVAMPRRWIERVQVVDYLQGFLVDRAGWSSLGALPRLAPEIAAFRRDRLREVGGWRSDLAQPHVELVARLHRWAGDNGRAARLVFVTEPVAWVPVAADRAGAIAASAREQAGVATALRHHARLLGRSRYGAAGLLSYPWLLVFSLLSPVVELVAMTLSAVVLGVTALRVAGVEVDAALPGWGALVLLALSWPVAGVLLGWATLLVDELSLSRYTGVRDLLAALWGVVLLHTVWRWLTTLPRLRTTWSILAGGAQAGRLGDPRRDCHTGESAPVHAHRR